MQKYEIIYTPVAYLNFEQILIYVRNDLKNRAEQFILDLKNKIDNLSLFPNLGKQVDKNLYLYTIHKNYIIYYLIKENNIFILFIKHVKINKIK